MSNLKKLSRKQREENLRLLDIEIEECLKQSALLGLKKFDLTEFARDCNIVFEKSDYKLPTNIEILFTNKAYDNFTEATGEFHVDDSDLAANFFECFLYEVEAISNKIAQGKALKSWFQSNDLKKIAEKHNVEGFGFNVMQAFYRLRGNKLEIIHIIDEEQTLNYEYPDKSHLAQYALKNQARPVSVKAPEEPQKNYGLKLFYCFALLGLFSLCFAILGRIYLSFQ